MPFLGSPLNYVVGEGGYGGYCDDNDNDDDAAKEVDVKGHVTFALRPAGLIQSAKLYLPASNMCVGNALYLT